MTLVSDVRDPATLLPPAGTAASVPRRWFDHVYLPTVALAAVTLWLLWVALSALDRAGNLWNTLAAGRAELVAPAIVVLVVGLSVAERRWPAQRRQVLAPGHVQDAWYLLLHLALVVPFMTLIGVAFAHLMTGYAPWLTIPWTAHLPNGVLLVVAIVLMDGANWLAHWVEHRIAPAWRLHALHHSQEELNVLTSFRHHPLSHLPGFFLTTIPVVAVMGRSGMDPALITGYVCLGTVPHANVRWTFGRLGRVFVSPAYHRLHHAIDGPPDRNLAVVLTVWDVLSGRARFPTRAATACRTGLARRPVPVEQAEGGGLRGRLLVAQLVEPFATANRRVRSAPTSLGDGRLSRVPG